MAKIAQIKAERDRLRERVAVLEEKVRKLRAEIRDMRLAAKAGE